MPTLTVVRVGALGRAERAGRAVGRPVLDGCGGAGLIGREVDDHVQPDEVRQVRRPGQMRVVGCGACGAREAGKHEDGQEREHRSFPHDRNVFVPFGQRQCIARSIRRGVTDMRCSTPTSWA